MSLKTLFRALGLVLGASIPLLAGPSSPPAGNYIQNVSTMAAAPAFSVSSGTVAGMLRVGSCQTLTGGSCGAGGGSTATINLATKTAVGNATVAVSATPFKLKDTTYYQVDAHGDYTQEKN